MNLLRIMVKAIGVNDYLSLVGGRGGAFLKLENDSYQN